MDVEFACTDQVEMLKPGRIQPGTSTSSVTGQKLCNQVDFAEAGLKYLIMDTLIIDCTFRSGKDNATINKNIHKTRG
ncbi:MAG: hypothetical protein H6696_18095 [Deferribacteres bacterium]|nr:hypothetical protein [Deferribacteres bacterium]